MLEDALDHNGNPGVVVLLTSDGAGYHGGAGFHRTLERMHTWLAGGDPPGGTSATSGCANGKANGLFIALDDHYDAITFMTPYRPGFEHALGRQSSPLDVSLRKTS